MSTIKVDQDYLTYLVELTGGEKEAKLNFYQDKLVLEAIGNNPCCSRGEIAGAVTLDAKKMVR